MAKATCKYFSNCGVEVFLLYREHSNLGSFSQRLRSTLSWTRLLEAIHATIVPLTTPGIGFSRDVHKSTEFTFFIVNY